MTFPLKPIKPETPDPIRNSRAFMLLNCQTWVYNDGFLLSRLFGFARFARITWKHRETPLKTLDYPGSTQTTTGSK